MNERESERVKFVDYLEPPETTELKIMRLLYSKGLILCNSKGEEEDLSRVSGRITGYIGILLNDPEAKPQNRWLNFIKRRPLREFVGILREDNSSYNEKTIVFELYGRKHVEWAKNLANELVSVLNIQIVIELKSQQSKKETLYVPDYGAY